MFKTDKATKKTPSNNKTISSPHVYLAFNTYYDYDDCYQTISSWLKLVAVERLRGGGEQQKPALTLTREMKNLVKKRNCAPELLF